ncbi:MAG: ABC transporter permease [Acidobacteriota bacterium]
MAMIQDVLQDIRAAVRGMRRAAGFSGAAILVMTLSIGVVAALFGVVNAVWFRPLPYPDSRQLTMVWQENPVKGRRDNLVSARNFLDWRKDNKVFESLTAFRRTNCALAGAGGQSQAAEYVSGAQVSSDLFNVFGIRPAIGREFSRAEELEGNDGVLLLGHRLWQRRFNSDPTVVGTVQSVNGKPVQVVGVMPEGFQFPESAELWMPLGLTELDLAIREMRTLYTIGRLRTDTSLAAAQQAMAGLAATVDSPSSVKAGWTVRLRPLHEQVIQNALPALSLLIGAALLILLIAIANITTLMFVRAGAYQRSIAIKSALGATRWRLIRQLLIESMILAGVAGALSLVILIGSAAKLRDFVPANLFRAEVMMVDYRVVAFTILLSLLVGAAAVVLPAIKATSSDRAREWLRTGHGQTAGRGEKRKASGLVMVQIGVLTVLLILSALITRSFVNLTEVHVGFATDHLLTMALDLSKSQQAQSEAAKPEGSQDQGAALIERMLEHIAALPGVRAAASVNALPLSGDFFSTNFNLAGQPESANEENTAEVRVCSANYLQAMGIPLLGGRHFDGSDAAGAAKVAIINQTMARQYWPGTNPVGAWLEVDVGDAPSNVQIVGVAGDVKDLGLRSAVASEIYVPLLQHSFSAGRLVVKTTGDPMASAPTVIEALQEVDRGQPVFECQSMDALLARVTAPERALTELMVVIAALAVLLVVVGVYCMTNHAFARRTQEFGVRIAIGATPRGILMLTIRQAFLLALSGAAVGVLVAMLAAKTLEHFLFGIGTTDPATYVMMTLVGIVTAVLASLHPALRASRTNPMTVIRSV